MEMKRSSMEGSSLVEVMISLFVFAIGILGVLSMQAQSVKLNNNAFLYSKANILAVEMMEHMRASPDAAETFAEGLARCDITNEDRDACCGNNNGAWADATNWSNDVAAQLPGGQGQVVLGNNDLVQVVVCFNSGVNEATEEFAVGVVNLVTLL